MNEWRRLYAPEDGEGGSSGGGAAGAGAGAGSGAGGKADEGGAGGDKGAGAGDGKGGSGPAFPENWRQLLTQDEKELKQLGRYATPADVWKKARSLESRLSSGELRPVLPKDASPEDLAKWRTEVGVPETHDKYDLGDYKVTDANKIAVSKITEWAHKNNLPASQVQDLLRFRDAVVAEELGKAKEQTDGLKSSSEEQYRTEWAGDYKRNWNVIGNMFEQTADSSELKADLMEAAKINPAFGKWLLSVAMYRDPTATIIPAKGSGATGIESEIAEIEGWMKSAQGSPDHKRYWKDEKVQSRYRDLLRAREAHKDAA